MRIVLKDERLIQEFVLEAKGHVEKIESGLLAIEKGQYDENLIHVIFRSAHNIKGTAGFFGFHNLVALSHAIESVLGKIRSKDITITLRVIDALLVASDELRKLLDNIITSEQQDITKYVQELEQIFIRENSEIIDNVSFGTGNVPVGAPLGNRSHDIYRLRIHEVCKKGHKIYKYRYGTHTIPPADTEGLYANMEKSIKSIGTMLTSYVRANVWQEGGTVASGLEAIFLFSTVLEKELTVMALGANKEDIVEFDVPRQEAEIFQILADSVTKSDVTGYEFLGREDLDLAFLEEKTREHEQDEERIRVDVELLNQLVNLASEMVLARNQLLRVLEKNIESIPGIRPILQKIDHTTTEMQEKIMRTRMQPVSILFQPMPRLVRELSRKLGKSITLRMEGKDVEMDKSILEGLVDPFTHLVRNALDHGIEDPAMRKTLGKDPIATLVIKARHEGGRVIVDIIDDGAGINSEKIKQQALKLGLIHHEEVNFLSESKVLDYIFSPGLSTVSKVSDISGRGVGLDVVRSNIEKFGGTVEVYTTKGKGTTFRLLLPLTLAIIPSLILAVEKNYFALPQAHLQEIVRVVEGQDIGKIQSIQGQEVLWLRGNLVPIIHLSEVIGLVLPQRESQRVIRILIIKIKKNTFGLIVDEIHGQEEILVRPMPTYIRKNKVYSGVTILGDGSIAMVLDTNGVADAGKFMFVEETIQNSQMKLMTVESKKQELQELLLFQCSGPETLGLHLSMIARVNEINLHQIEKIGDKEYYNVQGNVIRLVRLESYLPIVSREAVGEKMYVIVPKVGKQSIGILVRKIKDTAQVDLLMAEDKVQGKGLLGSTIVSGKIILVLDLCGLFTMIVPECDAVLEGNHVGIASGGGLV